MKSALSAALSLVTETSLRDETYDPEAYGQKISRDIDHRRKVIEDEAPDYGEYDNEYTEILKRPETRKVVRVRVPVIRSRAERQHKYTVVRRRPLVTYVKSSQPIVVSSPTARRIVVTRVRSRGPANQLVTVPKELPNEETTTEYNTPRHRVTVTRRRKIRPTSTPQIIQRPRVTRKKLLHVRPIVQPTPTFAIITTGFYSAPTTSDEEDASENSSEEELPISGILEESEIMRQSEKTPNLEESPNDIDSKPQDEFNEDDEALKVEADVTEVPDQADDGPVIITDNFFFPDQAGDVEQDDDDYYYETTTVGDNEPPSSGGSTHRPEESSTDTDKDRSEEMTDDPDESSDDTNEDAPETTTSWVTTESPEILTQLDPQTTELINEQTVEKTETSTIPMNETDETDEPTESKTDYPTTELSMDQSVDPETTEASTVYNEEELMDAIPGNKEKPVTIHIEKGFDDLMPEITEKPVTIHIEDGIDNATRETTSSPSTAPIQEESGVTPEVTGIKVEAPNVDDTLDELVTSEVPIVTDEMTDGKATTVMFIESSSDHPITESNVSIADPESPIAETESPTPTEPIENDEDLRVLPIESYEKSLETSEFVADDIRPSLVASLEKTENPQKINLAISDNDLLSVIPLELADSEMAPITTSYSTPTTEDIEAGLADDLYLSLSRADFPDILPSKSIITDTELTARENLLPTPELSTSVFYTETIVTSTKLRTYTYVVTKLNGLETEVTSSTTVRPRVTTLTLTVPVTVTISPILETSARNNVVVAPVYSPVSVAESENKEEEEGRRFNLATRIMSNGVEVIVAGPTPALRWENSNPQPTLTLSDTVVMLMPQEDPNEFVTKTCTTTFTYLNTITKDGATIVSTDQQVVANTATEERHRKTGTELASVTLKASPTLRTEVFKTTYTYLTLNTDHPDANNALGSSMKVITNTVTAPQHYLDMLEPSEAPLPETNTYLSTRLLEKTYMEDGRTKIETSSDTITQLIITESAPPPPRPTSVATTLTALDKMDESMNDITKTYFITYTYLNTYLEKGSTVIRTNIATSTDVVLEKAPAKKTAVQSVSATPTPEPIQIFATKTYLTTFTYFTTLLQAGADGETSTTISSRSHIVENVVTESIAPSLLDAGYMNALLTTAHHSDSVKNVVTGSTIIFFDEDDQIDPTTTSSSMSASTSAPAIESSDKLPESTPEPLSAHPPAEVTAPEAQSVAEPVVATDSENNSTSSSDVPENKRPSTSTGSGGDLQVSNLLSLGSLGINSLSALGPVITAMAGMAGLLQSKSTATRRNDTEPTIEAQEATTQRSPIYIPVADFADGDIETAESQNIAAQLVNPGPNYIPETRHKVAASLADGIPISPGEVITANSDVIIGKPGKLGPRPPHSKDAEHIGMKPPPVPVPNIPVHPVLEVIRDDETDLQAQSSIQSHRNTQIQILSAHQIYEKHLKVPAPPTMQRPGHIGIGSPLRQAGNKQDHLENDPLLIPPTRPNVEQYANPSNNRKDVEWNRERFRRPWSAKDPLTPPLPQKYDIQAETSQENRPWPIRAEVPKRPAWAQSDPLQGDTGIILESSETKPRPSEPIIHQVPHVIDRSTGQPLLVNIQPSQVANVVIPQGGTQALIFGDTSEPHISGQYFDDPSPYPEPEVGPGFIGVDKIQNDPADYMVPPAPPVNFKPLPQNPNNRDHTQTVPLSHLQSHYDPERPQESTEIATSTRPDKRPSEILLIQRPDTQGQTSGQGHVHTEILVHHRPESINVRPQSLSHLSGNSHRIYQEETPKRDHAYARPSEQQPPRRSEIVSGPTDNPHQYIYLENKPVNEATSDHKVNWKFDRKHHRSPPIPRPDRRPSIRPHSPIAHNYPIFERPSTYLMRKPQYPMPSSRPHVPTAGHFSIPNRYPQTPYESPKKPATQVRPLQSYGKEPIRGPSNVGQEISQPIENVPTGAIGYYNNPSNEPKIKPIDAKYYPQLPTVKPEVQSFGEILPHPEDERETPWKIDTQTERTADSIGAASDSVHLQNGSQDHRQQSEEQMNKRIVEMEQQTLSASGLSTESGKIGIHSSSTYDTVGSINALAGRPIEGEQKISQEDQNNNPSKFDYANQSADHQYQPIQSADQQYQPIHSTDQQYQPSHSTDQNYQPSQSADQNYQPSQSADQDYQPSQSADQDYQPSQSADQDHQPSQSADEHPPNRETYENPIVHGKPYGIYDRTDLNGPSNENRHENERPDYEVIQGVPFSQHDTEKPNMERRPIASGPYDRDVTMDLTPPTVTPSFNSESARPFLRPQTNTRPEIRPVTNSRPEHEDVQIDTKETNDPMKNRHTSIADEPHRRPGDSPDNPNNPYPSYEWPQISQTSENLPSQSSSPIKDQSDFGKFESGGDQDERKNRTSNESNQSISYFPSDIEPFKTTEKSDRGPIIVHTSGTRVHPAYPHILTKPRPRVPGPITITSNSKRPDLNADRRKIQFSLPVDATGEEKDSKTQTERPPSMLITANSQKNKKQKQETLVTASQTNYFGSHDRPNDNSKKSATETKKQKVSNASVNEQPRIPSQNMMPPPLTKAHGITEKSDRDALKPPARTSDVLGLSPPPLVITTTDVPQKKRFPFTNDDETGLRPPPEYMTLKETTGTVTAQPPPPSTKMVPPNPRPTMARPFLADLLSQDMVPPPLVIESSRPAIEIATVRPAIAVSGSIQIATAVAASHIPVMQDIESKIPIVHGTVDLPVVMDVSDIMKPHETDRSEHVSVYTVRPFETRPISRVSVQPTTIVTSNLIMPTKLRNPQIGHVETVLPSIANSIPTKIASHDVQRKPTRRPEHPVFLEPSRQHTEPTIKIEATQSLIRQTNKVKASDLHSQRTKIQLKSKENSHERPTIVTRVHSTITRTSNNFVPRRDKFSKTKEISGTVIQEVMKNGTTATMEMKPKAVTHFKTLTVTRTETSVLGSPPTTRTLLLTHTLTSTIVETVTETLLRPTSVVATVTSTVLQPVTRLPNAYENAVDNDSIFVVMSDQNPPAPGAEEVEAEYGEDEVSRDEQEPAGNEIHRVLAGGILGAPVAPMKPPINHCQPECKASKAEVCSEVGNEARCVCRPGFARMFLDRPCKPTYTYTVRVGLERMGREPIFYESALNDTSSTAFRRLATPTKEALDRTMMQSDLRDIYRNLDVAGFVPNPVQVEFHVQLTDNANETRLKDVLRKYLVGSNYSLGGTEVYAAQDLDAIEARDFDECSSQAGGPHHDCSPHAACFNLRGSYQCSCKEGWADLSENPAYPGRVCSQAPLGCAACNNKGHCTTNTHGHEVCECFPWHSGQRCQVNLKVLLIALVTTGAILLGLLAVCVGLACFRGPGRRGKSADRRAMIPGAAGDTSSEGSVTDLAIPHHVPHILPPPPRTVAPAPPSKRPARKITPNGKPPTGRKVAVIGNEEHGDRSLTVMIPRAKYRSTPQQQAPQCYKPSMSTFAADEHKLLSFLEGGTQTGIRKPSVPVPSKDIGKSYDDSGTQIARGTTSGALVSAGFQVSATVTRTGEAESTLARSCAGTAHIEPSTKTARSSDLQGDVGSTLARSCADTSTSTKLLRLDFGDSSGSTLAKSCGDTTTIQTSTKLANSRRSDSKDTRDPRDSGSEGHLTLERDLGSTLRLTSQHPTLFKPDRTSDRDSNFDSL